ncbi:MAG TPA: hypothetical protein DD640_01135 [Clostridiales bacterium]|nr:hypothetical protein [Clostridiales bacterium]
MINLLVAKNILSFRDLLHVELGSATAILGKNGAGKTNILKLIRVLKRLATNDFSNVQALAKTYEYRFKDESLPILLGASFNLGEANYEILFKFSQLEGFISQQLNYVSKSKTDIKKTCLFDSSSNDFHSLTSIEYERLKTYIWSKESILHILATQFELADRDFQNHIRAVSEFFIESINTAVPDLQNAAGRVYNNEALKDRILKVFTAMDFCITDIQIEKRTSALLLRDSSETIDSDQVPTKSTANYRFQFEHKNKYWLPSNFESAGILKLFRILSVLLDEKNEGEIWLFDELENSLHEEIYQILPLLVKDRAQGQIIFTSHNTSLLDKKILTKKQVVIVRSECGEFSDVISLNDFTDLRNDSRSNWQRWYRQNRFGGYPEINLNQIIDKDLNEDQNHE